MNQENLDFLKKSLKFLGFGEKLNADLEDYIKNQPKEFKLSHAGEFKLGENTDRVNYRLDFRKSDTSDMYFLNRHEATLKNDDPEKEKMQTFYINKGSGVTAKEAYNLLSGRAINKDLYTKEGQPYNAWLQLDLTEKDKNGNHIVKQYSQNYGFDLEAAVKKYPIKELQTESEKKTLMESLEKGNLQQVVFVKEGKEVKMFVEASPKFKNLNVYDTKMEKQFHGVNQREKQSPDKSKEQKESIKPDGENDEEEKKQKKSKRKGVRV